MTADPTLALGFDGADALLVPSFAIGLALVHVFAGRLRFLDAIPRSRWLSAAGGVSVAYVFVHVLPEVGAAGAAIGRSDSAIAAVEHHVYLVALLGFVGFYGLERFVRERAPGEAAGTDAEGGSGAEAEAGARGAAGAKVETSGVFWIHVGSFAAYNALVGYLLVHREEPGEASLVAFFVAMAVHFVVNDRGLREHHGGTYHRYGRWVLAGSVLCGTAVGVATRVSELSIALLFAFLAGGVVLNVMKEELPAERRSRFGAFAAGAAGYAALLLAA